MLHVDLMAVLHWGPGLLYILSGQPQEAEHGLWASWFRLDCSVNFQPIELFQAARRPWYQSRLSAILLDRSALICWNDCSPVCQHWHLLPDEQLETRWLLFLMIFPSEKHWHPYTYMLMRRRTRRFNGGLRWQSTKEKQNKELDTLSNIFPAWLCITMQNFLATFLFHTVLYTEL